MDSGNSGSLQSSSGGDDEFDSRAGGGGGGVDSSPLSALLRPSPSPSAAAFSLHGSYFGLQELTSAPPLPLPQQQAGTWSSGSFAGTSGLSSSSSPLVAQPDSGSGGRQQAGDATVAAAPAPGQGAAMGALAQPPRGSRKRTRASRRAPTTVLTTDTSNFRAMVQEFTGIPSPPFGAGVGVGGPAASLRTRFDHIFSPPSSLRSAADATASLPPYLLRPFPHKLPTVSSSFPPFTTASSSSSSSSTLSSSNLGAANASAPTGTAAAPSNPVAPDTFQQLTSSALLRLQDPSSSYLSFQNLLDSQPSTQSIFGAADGGFGQAASRLHDPAPSPSDFHGGLLGSEGLHLHHPRSDVHGHGGDELSGVVAGGSCKLNYSHAGAAATSSPGAASADKPPDGGAGAPGRPGRGEGLDPWICTSE
ncbi:VQ motif-containing protein [Zea mays]|uniref:VQ motif-containing protein n=1 Tax=Zea mays TaxID=4577 RepID=A0A1D6EPD3_MAIZE|nr:VQ motif-containing protein [Zea mays]